jgi:hypothetical protein
MRLGIIGAQAGLVGSGERRGRAEPIMLGEIAASALVDDPRLVAPPQRHQRVDEQPCRALASRMIY